MGKGVFTISLDFELHWGGFEKWPLAGQLPVTDNRQPGTGAYNQYFLNTRQVIPQMLALFEKYNVHVTWATVGMLFHETKRELLANAPEHKPAYVEQQLSAYHYINHVGIGDEEESDPFHFAPSLIRQILATPHQEVGTHTFAHYYCNEAGQNILQFQEDLRAAQRVAKEKYGCSLRSLVFPRNQFNDQYLKVCFEEGITSVRSNPLDWFWHIESTQHESAWKRLNRGLDAYFPIGKKNTYPIKSLQIRDGFPICVPASRLLRPYNPKEFFLNDFKIQRIMAEMNRAAQRGEVYHVWWHPHNFGNYPEESLQALEKILHNFQRCKTRHGMDSLNMGELSAVLRHG
ncbi:MAG: polysaccharide deacetylase family protein [Cyclobacteriaceae bacterium]|nr:polysaccharide deacetylase family protein [Cyclobacteriaceae bacterium]